MTFWRWLTTSRYARSLEERVAELKQQIESKDRELERMRALLIPGLRKVQPVTNQPQGQPVPIRSNGTTGQQEPETIHLGNWLQSLQQLESAPIVKEPEFQPSRRRNSDERN